MNYVSEKSFRENRICILYSITSSENLAIYETMSKNMVVPHRSQMTRKYGVCALHAG
jgi:hypothetical protein